MSYRHILLSVDAGIAEVTINRSEKLNALNESVRTELTDVFDALADRGDAKVAILCGAGDKAFVAGADVSEFAARTPEEQREVYARRRVYDALAEFPKPVICAIHGFCLGGGNELALACDVRVADSTARFGQFEVRLGLIPGAGGTQRLARLVGPGQAMRIGLCGDFVDAAEAHRIGLVEFLVAEGQHVAEARRIAGRMARWSPRHASAGQEGRARSGRAPSVRRAGGGTGAVSRGLRVRGRTGGRQGVRREAPAPVFRVDGGRRHPSPRRYRRDRIEGQRHELERHLPETRVTP